MTKRIPYGRVATYGQIAAALGSPRAARMVGTALSRCSSDIPWHRVINRRGMVSIENLHVPKEEQAARLQAEGIEVELRDNNFFVPLKKFLVDDQLLIGH